MTAPNLAKSKAFRKQLYKKHRLSGLGLKESALLAGYAPSTAGSMAGKRVEKDLKLTIAQQLDKAGLTDQKLSEELERIAMKGTKHIVVDKEIREVPDLPVRVKAIDLATTLKGYRSEKNFNLNNTQVKVVVQFPEDDEDEDVVEVKGGTDSQDY